MKNRSYESPSFQKEANPEVQVPHNTQLIAQSKFFRSREFYYKVLIYGGLVIEFLALLSIFNTESLFSSVWASAFGFLVFAMGLVLFCISPEGSPRSHSRELRKQDNFTV
ncbi:hypothetical protein ACX3PU_03660 [Chryseobacterium sp. A301]